MRTKWNGIAATRLLNDDGASALIADHGAHLLSWIPAGGEEALFMSSATRVGASDAIRGGVPIIFPQFGERGTGMRHGFARINDWKLVFYGLEQGCAVARYILTPDDTANATWPHAFRLTYEITISVQQLSLVLSVENPSDSPWQFNAALHTYLQVQNINTVEVDGLQHVPYLDHVNDDVRQVQSDASLRFDGEVDRVYLGTPGAVRLNTGGKVIISRQHGFQDTVVWNPGANKAAMLSDLTPGAQARFVCIEAAMVNHPVTLSPGQSWQGEQLLAVY